MAGLRQANRLPRPCLGLIIGFVPVASLTIGATLHAQSAKKNPDEATVRSLIARLSDESPEVRKTATEQLLAVGPSAIPALRQATQSDDFETVVRARALLSIFKSLLFVGAEITLRPSAETIRPRESLDLELVVKNTGDFAVNLPFESRRESTVKTSSHARQVGDLLDLADHLIVTDPSGARVELVVDDIRQDQAVLAAVQWRASDDPPNTELPAARTFRRTIRSINRGWARYPMTRTGRYSIQLVYQPDWDDERLKAEHLGRVTSNTCHVTVADNHPTEPEESNTAPGGFP